MLGERNAKNESSAAYTVKAHNVVNEFPAEFGKTAMNELFCKLCECVVTCSKKFFVDSEIQTALSETKRQPVNSILCSEIFCRPYNFAL